MQRATFTLALLFAGQVIGQDLPPGVLLLSRVKNQFRTELQRLTAVTCLETVHREQQLAKSRMRPLDTIRLEVLTDGEKELFASPGDRKFSEQHPLSFGGGGTLGNGLFGIYLKSILLNDFVTSEYQGEEEVAGRRLARYDYRVPPMWSGQTIRTPEGSGPVGLHGSYWADPQTYDVIRLERHADTFPPTLPVTELAETVNYARTRLAENLTVLLPEAAELRMVKDSGEISHNLAEFTHCRVFGAESTVEFGQPGSAEQTPRFGVAVLDETLRPLPPDLQIAVKLRTRISGDMPVGTLIDGVVASNVMANGALAVPAGSAVRGRIRRMEHCTDPMSYFVVGLEFTEVEVEGIRHIFFADLDGISPTLNVEQTLTINGDVTTRTLTGTMTKQTGERVSLYNLPGVAAFFFKGAKLDLPEDFRTVWKTRPLKP
jgi:hypothetical protein